MNFHKHSLASEPTGSWQVIVLTNTDVRKDPRILKEIRAMLSLEGVQVFAVGVEIPESAIPSMDHEISNLRIQNVDAQHFHRCFRRFYRPPRRKTVSKISIAIELIAKILTGLALNFRVFFAALKGTDRAKVRVIYCNDDQPLLAASVLAAITQSKMIYDAHELNHDRNGQLKLERQIVALWERFFWPKVDYFVTVSESIRLHYLETYGPKASAVVLNSPSFLGKAPKNQSIGDVRSVLGLGLEDIILLYAGAFSEGRGIRLLLECAGKLPLNYHVVFLGEGRLLPEIAGFLKTSRQVHVISPVAYDRVVGFISTADIGLCLIEPVSMSDRFSLPNKFFDYAFAGLPILYSDFPEMSQVAQNYGLGEKCENSADSFLSAVFRLKGRRSARVSLAPLSWENQEKVICGVINSFLTPR